MKDGICRNGGCYCNECEMHGKDGWCRQWENYTEDDGFCHKGELVTPEYDEVVMDMLREERERHDMEAWDNAQEY